MTSRVIVHFYTSRSLRKKTMRALCGKVPLEIRGGRVGLFPQVANGTTSDLKVTCTACLPLLVDIRIKQLDDLKVHQKKMFTVAWGGTTMEPAAHPVENGTKPEAPAETTAAGPSDYRPVNPKTLG